jgi:transcriptional regulator with XRE-family HTH domain
LGFIVLHERLVCNLRIIYSLQYANCQVLIKAENDFRTQIGRMAGLRSVLAFNMKARRQILGISQAQLAEKAGTSTNYVALIETEKRFPKPEMLERIAAALEIESPALFAVEIRPLAETEILARVQRQILGDIAGFVAHRLRQLGQETPPDSAPGMDEGPAKV